MLNSVLLITWFCFRNGVDLCQLANSDIIKKEKKSLVWGGLLKKKKFLEKLHLGSISIFLLLWEKFNLPFSSSYLS